jgi:uncharacterized SAM-binding protein YcdF (DUF218 family)
VTRPRRLVLALGLTVGLALSGPLASLAASLWEVGSPPSPADVIVVLGGGVTWPGELTCQSLVRAQHGAFLYREGLAPRVILSGGGKRGDARVPTEAQLMAQLVRGLGVPESAILIEDQSRRTRENATRSAALMRREHLRKALLVTDAIHMRRARLAFLKAGADVSPATCPTPWALALWPHQGLFLLGDLAYEVFALGFYKLWGWA